MRWIGLLLVCYGVWRLVQFAVADLTRQDTIEELESLEPLDPHVRVRRAPYDWRQEESW